MTNVGRRALVVGIDKYLNVPSLAGCENDARAVAKLLQSNEDTTPNYDVAVVLASRIADTTISRAELREQLQTLFAADYRGDVLLYYSGHGALTTVGGCIATSDAVRNDLGIPMTEVLQLACQSSAREIFMILDCCHSGDLGAIPLLATHGQINPLSLLRENMTILAASKATQVAVEAGGHGLFTSAFIDALEGGAADHMGWVTAPAIYAYVERRFGEFDQRPVYRSHATEIGIVRQCAPLIERLKLNEMVTLFATETYRYQLDPEFEPEDEHGNLHEPVNQEKIRLSRLFKDFRDTGLLRTSTGEQLFWAARKSQTVELTIRGREYWRLVKNRRI
jgi:hypothetical protein